MEDSNNGEKCQFTLVRGSNSKPIDISVVSDGKPFGCYNSLPHQLRFTHCIINRRMKRGSVRRNER